MKKVKVRCWEIDVRQVGCSEPHKVFITYPSDNNGHKLISCLRCGEIYAVTILKEVYEGPSLEKKLQNICCMSCGSRLSESCAVYPETYVNGGNSFHYVRSREIPMSEDSMVREFWGIYE